MSRTRKKRMGDLLLAVIVAAVLIALAAVLLVAPRSTPPEQAAAVATTTAETSPSPRSAAKDLGDAGLSEIPVDDEPAKTSPTPRPATATPAPTVGPTLVPARATPTPSPAPTAVPAGANPKCVDVTPGPTPRTCITLRRKRTVVLGGLGAPVGVRGAIVSVRKVDVLKTKKKGYVQVRLQGGLSLPASSNGSIPRANYYLGYGKTRVVPTRLGTGLRAARPGRDTPFRISFQLRSATAERAARPGARMRLVYAPRGVTLSGMGRVGVIVIDLANAYR